MRKFLAFLTFSIFIFGNIFSQVFADAPLFGDVQPGELAMTVSPVRYELSTGRGGTITKPITIYNRSKFPVFLTLTAENFLSKGTDGQPTLLPQSETQDPQTHLASWTSTDINSINLAAGDQKDVNFTIHVPTDATPGGHYGAILFNYRINSSGTTLGTARRIGVLVLLNVSGQVIVQGNVTGVRITGDGGGAGASQQNNIVGKSFQSYVLRTLTTIKDSTIGGTTPPTDNGSGSVDTFSKENKIDFSITFSNDGNTHIKPEGKITITDENGNVLKGIGKKIVKNEADAYVGEKVVDYIPINDQGGNVLPGTKRIFETSWQGFPYETINDKGEKVVKYKNLSDYYTDQNLQGRSEYNLHFWEQLKSRLNNKILTADISVIHKDKDGKDIEYNSAKEIKVSYKESYIGLNVPVVVALGISSLIILGGILKWLSATGKAATGVIASSSKVVALPKKSKTYYEILDVKKSASKKEIDEAYKLLSGKKGPSKDVKKAYEVLSKKPQREEYDKSIKIKK